MYIIQLVEILHVLDSSNPNYSLSIARQLPKCVYLWSLASALSTDPNPIWEEALIRLSENAHLSYLASRFWFGHMADEENCANALRVTVQNGT